MEETKHVIIMRTPIVVLFVAAVTATFAQSESPFEAFLRDTVHLDSGQALIEVTVIDKLTNGRPDVIYKATPVGLVPDEKPERLRHQVVARISGLFYWRRNLRENFQPHIFFDVNALTTYLSTKSGVGFTKRSSRFSFGAFVGNYLRRTNEVPDVTYRARGFEKAMLYGAYVHCEPEDFSFLFSYAIEEFNDYRRIFFAWKAGETIDSRFVPKGLRVHLESESFLGTGAGISYRSPNGHLAVAASYLVPDRDERTQQRVFAYFLENGISLSIRTVFY